MRRVLAVVTVFLLVNSLPISSAFARGHRAEENGPDAKGRTEAAHTITWWCVDLNDLLHVDVPVVVGRGFVIPPDPSPIPDPCTSPFPVTVPNGETFVPDGGAIWYTNKIYPPAVRAALQAMGYNFHSQSPAEDFMSKMVQIRVEVRTLSEETLVAEFRFDPRRYFRLVRAGEFFGLLPVPPIVDPALGIDISSDDAKRLPLFDFPVIAGPVPPGEYRNWIYWTLSDLHNDGTGLGDASFLPAGEFLYEAPRFIVLQ